MRLSIRSGPIPPALLLALSACGLGAPAPQAAAPAAGWREIATEDDRGRLRGWRGAWVEALAKARAAGHGAAIAREGALLDPDLALPGAAPPPGLYRCRVLKIGAQRPGMLDYIAYPAFQCRIEADGDALGFAKTTGSQRPIGRLLPDNDRRLVFLGTLQLGDESVALRYGHDRERNMAGFVERIGERRWRLALPSPHFESTLDVIELIPVDEPPVRTGP